MTSFMTATILSICDQMEIRCDNFCNKINSMQQKLRAEERNVQAQLSYAINCLSNAKDNLRQWLEEATEEDIPLEILQDTLNDLIENLTETPYVEINENLNNVIEQYTTFTHCTLEVLESLTSLNKLWQETDNIISMHSSQNNSSSFFASAWQRIVKGKKPKTPTTAKDNSINANILQILNDIKETVEAYRFHALPIQVYYLQPHFTALEKESRAESLSSLLSHYSNLTKTAKEISKRWSEVFFCEPTRITKEYLIAQEKDRVTQQVEAASKTSSKYSFILNIVDYGKYIIHSFVKRINEKILANTLKNSNPEIPSKEEIDTTSPKQNFNTYSKKILETTLKNSNFKELKILENETVDNTHVSQATDSDSNQSKEFKMLTDEKAFEFYASGNPEAGGTRSPESKEATKIHDFIITLINKDTYELTKQGKKENIPQEFIIIASLFMIYHEIYGLVGLQSVIKKNLHQDLNNPLNDSPNISPKKEFFIASPRAIKRESNSLSKPQGKLTRKYRSSIAISRPQNSRTTSPRAPENSSTSLSYSRSKPTLKKEYRNSMNLMRLREGFYAFEAAGSRRQRPQSTKEYNEKDSQFTALQNTINHKQEPPPVFASLEDAKDNNYQPLFLTNKNFNFINIEEEELAQLIDAYKIHACHTSKQTQKLMRLINILKKNESSESIRRLLETKSNLPTKDFLDFLTEFNEFKMAFAQNSALANLYTQEMEMQNFFPS